MKHLILIIITLSLTACGINFARVSKVTVDPTTKEITKETATALNLGARAAITLQTPTGAAQSTNESKEAFAKEPLTLESE